MTFSVTKTYGHDLGLSACFRQWRAESHCRHLHGYALAFKLTFAANSLDERNWVIDFGELKPVKQFLVDTFDHKLLVAMDDPELGTLGALAGKGVADVLVLPHVGCEAFAAYVADHVKVWLAKRNREKNDTRALALVSVQCAEHGANSAGWVDLHV